MNLQGSPVLAATAPVARARWTVFVEQQRSEALRPVWVSLARSTLLLAAGVALAVVASVLLARRLVRPIRELQAQAERMAAGRLDQRIELRTGDELQALGEQFNAMAASLEATYTSLESRVAQRTVELAQANEAKSRFLAAASHDLRQPVHALSLLVGQLRSQGADAAQAALVQRIEGSLAAFETLLESLLDISRLDAGTVPVARQGVDLRALLLRLSETFEPVARAKGLHWKLRAGDLWVETDPVLLERILLNLVGNALRYTARGRIVLACRRRGDRIGVFVADTGIGIAQDQLPHIFREFHRSHGLDYNGEIGLGLGLAIVERLALLLGHELRVSSRRGSGSCFGVLMPRVDALEPSLLVEPAVDTGLLPGRRILVVDDDESVLEAMRGLLVQWGCVADVARDGDRAMSALMTHGPWDLAIVDLRLGREDGLAVAERLCAAAAAGTAPAVVVLTGESDPSALRAVQAAGYALLTKPVRPAKLRALLEAVFVSARPP
jgi:signal transduction histidine kinase/CheY-like chemotaxis protein